MISKAGALALAVCALAIAWSIEDLEQTIDTSPLTPGILQTELKYTHQFDAQTPASANDEHVYAASNQQPRRRELSGTSPSASPAPHADNHSDGGHGHLVSIEDHGLLFITIMVGTGVMIQQLLKQYSKYVPIPYTVMLVGVGGLFSTVNSIGTCEFAVVNTTTNCTALYARQCKAADECTFTSTLPSSLGMLGDSIDVWSTISPDFLLYFFIPFKEIFRIDSPSFTSFLAQCVRRSNFRTTYSSYNAVLQLSLLSLAD